jgi:hypothetical protein
MAVFRRCEVWSDLVSRGGTRLAAVRIPLVLREGRRVSGAEDLTLGMAYTDPAVASLRERRVVRVVYSDDTWAEWRIVQIERSHKTDNGLFVTVTCADPSQDLGQDTIVARVEADGTVRLDFEAIGLTIQPHVDNFILPSLQEEGETFWAVGTIDSTAPVDMVYATDTPLAVIQRLAQTARLEFRVRANGTTGYYLDFLQQVGASAPAFDIRLGKNLAGVQSQVDTSEMTNRVYPRGTEVEQVHGNMAHAQWLVAAVAGNTLTLQDPAGFAGPFIEDDQLTGFHVQIVCGGSPVLVTGSTWSPQQITVADATGFTVGTIVEFCRNATGEDLVFLELGSSIDLYGRKVGVLDRPDIPDTINLVRNPAMRIWTNDTNQPANYWCTVWSDGTSRCTFTPGSGGGGVFPLSGYGAEYGDGWGTL